MNDYHNQVTSIVSNMDDKELKGLQIDLLLRLLKKIEPDLNDELTSQVENVLRELRSVIQEQESKRGYKKALQRLRKTVRKELGYTAKGQLKEEILGIGIALGVSFGGAFLSLGVAFIGIGLPIGVAIGVAIGQSKEQEAEKNGKTY